MADSDASVSTKKGKEKSGAVSTGAFVIACFKLSKES